MKKIAIFASGGGSNARCILEHFKDSKTVVVALIVSNKPHAGVLQHARDFGISTHILDKQTFTQKGGILPLLAYYDIDSIILAGFLWLVPTYLVEAYPSSIINIHPSLLPAYGGKGMYGMNVHKAVFEANEKESGITIHVIDGEYDKGKIIFQKSVDISTCHSPEEIAAAVLKIEHQHFPLIIENYLQNG